MKLPDEYRARHPHVEWRAMTGMRDRLIHDYFGVDYVLVWDVVTAQDPGTAGHRVLPGRDAPGRGDESLSV